MPAVMAAAMTVWPPGPAETAGRRRDSYGKFHWIDVLSFRDYHCYLSCGSVALFSVSVDKKEKRQKIRKDLGKEG